MSVLQSEFAISLITIFYLKLILFYILISLHTRKNTLSFWGKLIKEEAPFNTWFETDGRITRYCDRIRKMVKLTIAE